jgi:predicted secreted protein
MKKLLATAMLICSLPLAAFAGWRDKDNLPPAGHTIVNLSVTERQQAQQDTLNASLRMELDGDSARSVQDRINKAMQQAVAKAKGAVGVKVTTGGYHIYSYDPNPQPRSAKVKPKLIWRGSQTIDLESKDSAKLLELTGTIQDMGFAMNGLNYQLSTEKAESFRDQLIERALATLKARAALMAKNLGKSGYELLEVNVDSNTNAMPYMAKHMMRAEMAGAAADVATPVAEPGQTDVTLTVGASVLLKP